MRTFIFIVTAAFLAGCLSSPQQTEPEKPLFEDSLSEEDKKQLIPRPVQAERPVESQPQPVGEGSIEVAQLVAGDTYVTANQVKMTLISKHPTSGGLELSWRLEKGDEQIDGFWTGRPFYYEATAFGTLYSIVANDGQTLITFHGEAPEAPIDVATAAQIATPTLRERIDCENGERVIAVGDTNGTLKLQSVVGENMDNPDVQCTVRIGLYTQRVID